MNLRRRSGYMHDTDLFSTALTLLKDNFCGLAVADSYHFKMIVNFAKRAFRNHPALVNSCVYGALYVGAEFTQQVITKKMTVPEKREEIDLGALARYLAVGSGINSNYLYCWYKWLDSKFAGTQTRTVAKKLLLDQLVMSPPLYAIFYTSMSIMEGREDLFGELREKFLKTLIMSYLFWVPAQIINFAYLPNRARVIYLGLCSYAWVNILSWLKRNGPGSSENCNRGTGK